MCQVDRGTKFIEAVERMKLLQLPSNVINLFSNDSIITESLPPMYASYEIDKEVLQDIIDEFEHEYNGLVYHVIHSFTNIGEMFSLLYVNDYIEEWEIDRSDIEEGQQCVYVYNKTMPDCSELGYIGFEKGLAGDLKRTW